MIPERKGADGGYDGTREGRGGGIVVGGGEAGGGGRRGRGGGKEWAMRNDLNNIVHYIWVTRGEVSYLAI
jgi:hypothetical protein